MSKRPITLLTDFGTRDYYVGAVKGVLLRLAPDSLPIDLTHEVAPGDIEQGAFLLAACHRWFPAETVHLAVVDPGVGSKRRILAARSETGFFVAPDNGLLSGVLEGAEIRDVQAAEVFLEAPGDTFHGRDRFAPVAAHLARGDSFDALGPSIDDPLLLPRNSPHRGPDFLEGRIVHIDRFGNLVTDIPSDWLRDVEPTALECRLPGLVIRRWVRHYAELAPGEGAFVLGSLGTLEISLNGESAALRADIERDRTLRIRFR